MTDTESPEWRLEEGTELQIDFAKMARAIERSPDVIPVAVQNADTKEVILVAYTNRQAFEKSVQTRIATFWSTSRNELWIKGATSGHFFELLAVYVNCEQNSLVYRVRPKGEGICHTRNSQGKARDCCYRRLSITTGALQNTDPQTPMPDTTGRPVSLTAPPGSHIMVHRGSARFRANTARRENHEPGQRCAQHPQHSRPVGNLLGR